MDKRVYKRILSEGGNMQYDVTWCEDCEYFVHADMGGKGWCERKGGRAWKQLNF